MSSILLVEDDPALSGLLVRILMPAGYTVSPAGTGAQALRMAHSTRPDLAILDLRLPDVRGEDLLPRLLATSPRTKVLVLSSVTDLATRVGVLDGGAVDYLAKPFSNSELLARIRARIRESPAPIPQRIPDQLTEKSPRSPDPSALDAERHEIVVDERRVTLTAREYSLVTYLARRAPEPCTRAELLEGVWGTTFDGGTNAIDACVKRLRSKLKDGRIETVRNVGYRLIPG